MRHFLLLVRPLLLAYFPGGGECSSSKRGGGRGGEGEGQREAEGCRARAKGAWQGRHADLGVRVVVAAELDRAR